MDIAIKQIPLWNGHTWLFFRGWRLGAFLRWWPPLAMWAGPLIFYGHNLGYLNNPIFSNLGLCAACWAHFMCQHELWPTSVSHPFSSLNSSLGPTGGKYYQKITIPIFRLIPQNFAFPGCFSYIVFYRYIFSLLSSDWVVIAVSDSVSVQGTISSDKSLFCCSFLIPFFLKLFVACRLCDIYVREDNDFNVYAMITQLMWTTWT